MEEERRKSVSGRRATDPANFRTAVIALLLLIVGLQITISVIYLKSRQKSETKPLPTPITQATPRSTPGVVLQIPDDPAVRSLVQQLQARVKDQASRAIQIENVQVVSATGIGNIVVEATLRHNLPAELKRAIGIIQLRTGVGELVYQATGELSLLSPVRGSDSTSGKLLFLIDNPPPFDQVEVALEQLDFKVEGYR